MLKKGLNDQQVRQSREKYGNNVIPDSEPTTFWAEFKETFIYCWAYGYNVLFRICGDL